MTLQYGIYDSPVPASFVRAAPPISLISAAPRWSFSTHAGVSVSWEMQTISVAARLAFQSSSKEIHKAGVLHGDLHRDLVDRLGRIAIIDFDQSKKTSSAEVMEREIEEFANLLGPSG